LADAVAPDVGFLPDRSVDRDHEALAAGLHAIAAEEQHHDGIRLDLRLEPADGAVHVVFGGILHHVDIKAVGAKRRRQAARVVDRLHQRLAGVGIMAVADDQREAGGPGNAPALLGRLGRDRLGGVERALVQRGMGADHHRHQAGKGYGDGDRAAGNPELAKIHSVSNSQSLSNGAPD
jgi:hypothetical protein